MSAKSRQNGLFSVRTPAAFAALSTWLAALDPAVRKRGRQYSESGQVLDIWAGADHYVQAEVEGQEVYETTLYLTRGQWTSSCSCPMVTDCKHAAAAAFVWIERNGVDSDADSPISTAPDGEKIAAPPPLPPAAPEKKKLSFREQWSPVIAAKLGRPLTDAEGHRLGLLAALFAEMNQSHGRVYPDMLQRYGFDHSTIPSTDIYTPAFVDWWDPSNPPADPWALWQYLATDYEHSGHPIPEVLRPMTDTTAVRSVVDDRLVKQELVAWRRALVPTSLVVPTGKADLFVNVVAVRARFEDKGRLFLEVRTSERSWKAPTQKWLKGLAEVRPADLESLTPPESALLLTIVMSERYGYSLKSSLPPEVVRAVLASHTARGAIVLPNGEPFAVEPEPLQLAAAVSVTMRNRLNVRLVTPDGRDAVEAYPINGGKPPLYLFEGRVWRGPPALPRNPLPTAAFSDPSLMAQLRAAGLQLPNSLEKTFRRIELRPLLRVSLADDVFSTTQFHAQLLARTDDPVCEQHWSGVGGWQWTPGAEPPTQRPDDPLFEYDLTTAQAASERFGDFRLVWNSWHNAWARPVNQAFPEEFTAWRASLPPGLAIEAAPSLAGLLDAPLRAVVDFSALPAEGAGRDWFDLTIALRVEDTTLAADEIALLLKARGKWVRLPKLGWRRLELLTDALGGDAAATLDRLGLHAQDVLDAGKPATHRLHALQLAAEAASLESRDAKLAAALRVRAAALSALPPPAVPAGLTATLRPYQQEGFHFLMHLFAQGFGGILADDMGLGKTVQTLAALLQLAETSRAAGLPFRALVVCPKSVVHGWLAETARFAPSLAVTAFAPALAAAPLQASDSLLLIANYAQLRLHASWFKATSWDVAVLDEGQFIKNPASQAAAAARALPARHRLVLTGTPVENRVTDLWSLFAFAQPGLLGTQAAFSRQHPATDPAALARLHRRVRHFLLRRTKAQAAPDLPPRTEDELVVELEPAQRKLYDAELKRARAQLLDIKTDRALDAVRFNVLSSLLRLRQICCHPALIDPAHAALPSAKLDALLERLEELSEEGHQVLVFSQFVEMLVLIRARLVTAGIGHLMLTGKTENRAELVETFQRDRTKTVFLLSLKAAGFGLNLTAASYAILYDPWWNPAVEAQAIDRMHRIGQLRPVTAYRLLASNTVEQKIRALQNEKSALAAAVVQEESLASVLDLDSLRRILL